MDGTAVRPGGGTAAPPRSVPAFLCSEHRLRVLDADAVTAREFAREANLLVLRVETEMMNRLLDIKA